ncbi:MAG: haloacid dehalogenase-like hydrolase [Prevotella sp.]|nr:haloacid dehalogenase-like hydrolase [Prevotella sp.]
MYNVYAFDFDGTLTKRDTLIEFIRYTEGTSGLIRALLRFSPLLLLMKLHVCSNDRVKQKLFAHLYAGMPAELFNDRCRKFASDRRELLREGGLLALWDALREPASKVRVVSASVDNWVRPFLAMNEPQAEIDFGVVGTEVEIVDGRLTGRFRTPNCYGEEKVRRLRKEFPDRAAYRLVAFGDSRGDRELLQWADQGCWKPFREGYDRPAFAALRKSRFFKLYSGDEVD